MNAPKDKFKVKRPKIRFLHNNNFGLLWKITYFVILNNIALPFRAYAQGGLNRFTESSTFGEIITKLAEALTIVALPFVVVFLVLSGFLFVTARGNEQQLAKAKTMFFWTVVGAALVVGAWAISVAVDNFASGLG